jgi:hypothetical protein
MKVLKVASIFIGIFLFFVPGGNCQTKAIAGEYSYGNGGEHAYGYLAIYSQNDSTVLFYIENGRGAPSYASGSLDGRLLVQKDSGVFVSEDSNWVLHFYFKKNTIKIIAEYYKSGNGYGYGVLPDGEYTRISNKKPEYFINREGDTTYFNKYKPAR